METDIANEKAIINRWVIVACLVILTTLIISCKKESKAMDINDVYNYSEKLANMKLVSKDDAEKQLGISLKHVDNANERFSFYEYSGELPAFHGSTRAEFGISNDNKGRWFVAIDFKLPICVDWNTVQNKFPGGEYILASPNNLSPDASNGYKIQINTGTLSFGFNAKSGCFTRMSFSKIEP